MSDRPLQLMLIDDDPVFRLGLRFWLNQFADLTVIAESDNGVDALEQLQSQVAISASDPATTPAIALHEQLKLVILSLSLGQHDPRQMQGLSLCEAIRQRYSQLPVLLLSSLDEPLIAAAAQQAGASGFCLKSVNTTTLNQTIRQVTTGQFDWQKLTPTRAVITTVDSEVTPLVRDVSPIPPAQLTAAPSALTLLRHNLRVQGLQQIDAAIADLTEQLRNLDLSLLNRAVLAGRYRELRASRWLVQRLLATPDLTTPPTPEQPASQVIPSHPESALTQTTPGTPLLNTVIDQHRLQALLFDRALSNIQTNLNNQTGIPLEIDILREDKKRELFYLVLRKFEELLNELRYSQVQPEQLIEKRSPILLNLWQDVTTDFIGKYYTITQREQAIEVVPNLLQAADSVQTEILEKIPLVSSLLEHLLFHTPLLINGTPYSAGNPESLARAEALLDHLLIQVANGVMQPLLNQFPNVEKIKQDFYDRQLMSSRDIERFRNNLSWRYRLARIVVEPTDIFESQYHLFVFQGSGIKQIQIYAPRTQELEELSGLRLLVTVALETRDAIAPRLRSAISVVGSGLVYVLTEVVGRGIGLIGRGVLKGIGYWQEGDRTRRR
ncbi:DUF3685 domain-containing protein [Oscillatoria sp. FACHB-1407]|uniref:DUF3685 domain-containing protein n=1 Tax=Oscillatoria sp. FACHB-1407 TaxID=2692847 RepID=UPI001684F650|nr:DUF3685 domain-containing protein [Oscillatoria sp. FACHB-1407]MBD2460814.1 DUF3685 domain-containing protein [Oscillatoria sp. FACHB-1407]